MKKLIILTTVAAVMNACTGDFKDINRPLYGVEEKQYLFDNTLVGANFIPLQKSILYNQYGWDYQIYQNLNADIFSGYTSSATHFGKNEIYSMNDGWNVWCWNMFYQKVMTLQKENHKVDMEFGFGDERLPAEAVADKKWQDSRHSHFLAVNNILRVFGMSRLTDQYGPIIYSQWGKTLSGSAAYDDMPTLYATFFKELTEAVEHLDKLIVAAGPETKNFARFDMVYGGDLKKWCRLANTLRLRLAMRIVKADKALAQKEAEAAIAAPQGLLETNADNYVLAGNGWNNPMYTCTVAYGGDACMSADVESILGGYGDPRLGKMGVPLADGTVAGMRLGISNLGLDPENEEDKKKMVAKDDYLGNANAGKPQLVSILNFLNAGDATTVIYCAEAYFLKAEAALRGWNAGGKTAKELYEAGIKASFDGWGVSVGDYLTSTKTPKGWKDPLAKNGGKYDVAAPSAVTPAWDAATSDEERLEKIITQKWIAGWPEGMNAWAEYRRTGYPKLIPVITNASGGVIDSKLGPRRLPYPADEYKYNEAEVKKAVTMLGGADNAATRLWWDKAVGNF